MRDVGIFIALAASVAALIISLAHRSSTTPERRPEARQPEQQHDDPAWFA